MAETVDDVCRHVRSKNAGPFWITLDLSFADQAAFDRYAFAPQLRLAASESEPRRLPTTLRKRRLTAGRWAVSSTY